MDTAQPRSAFEAYSVWYRGRYRVIEDEGVPVVAPDPEVSLEGYDPIEEAPPLSIRPRRREEHFQTPHLHLAYLGGLDPLTEQDVLNFANRWGLLGLWRVEEYRLFVPTLARMKQLSGGGDSKGIVIRLDGSPCSRWYGGYGQPNQEPLEAFAQAAQDFRVALDMATEVTSQRNHYWQMVEVAARLRLDGCRMVPFFRLGRWRLAWQYPSLLHALRLRAILDLTGGTGLRRCKRRRCGMLFIPPANTTGPTAEYCSDACRESEKKARQRANQRRAAIAEELYKQGMSPADVAAELDVSLETAEEWLSRLREGS